MGAHMARRLLKAGIGLTVYDTSKDACAELAKDGAQVAGSALDVANNTEVAFLSLPTPDIVQKVCAGLTGAKKLKIVVDCSTTGPGGARVIARCRCRHRCHYRPDCRQLAGDPQWHGRHGVN
jgi:3-hydroxyisobutyrate dehydrogenase-like beta-hydroxyacid dehydrogenase